MLADPVDAERTRAMLHNLLIDWTTNGGPCHRHSLDTSAPLSSNHRQR